MSAAAWFLTVTLVFGNPSSKIVTYQIPTPIETEAECATVQGQIVILQDETVQRMMKEGWRTDGWTCRQGPTL